jgi:hypothetical protein
VCDKRRRRATTPVTLVTVGGQQYPPKSHDALNVLAAIFDRVKVMKLASRRTSSAEYTPLADTQSCELIASEFIVDSRT